MQRGNKMDWFYGEDSALPFLRCLGRTSKQDSNSTDRLETKERISSTEQAVGLLTLLIQKTAVFLILFAALIFNARLHCNNCILMQRTVLPMPFCPSISPSVRPSVKRVDCHRTYDWPDVPLLQRSSARAVIPPIAKCQWLSTVLFLTHTNRQQEAQLSQRDRAAACLNFGKNISANSVHLTLLYVSALTLMNHHFTVLRHHVCT